MGIKRSVQTWLMSKDLLQDGRDVLALLPVRPKLVSTRIVIAASSWGGDVA